MSSFSKNIPNFLSVLSSAQGAIILLEQGFGKTLLYSKSKNYPNNKPCRTPVRTNFSRALLELPSETNSQQSIKTCFEKLGTTPVIANPSNPSERMWWSRVSNAFFRSMRQQNFLDHLSSSSLIRSISSHTAWTQIMFAPKSKWFGLNWLFLVKI